eukprot:3731796-Rhodomonas_salina.1
MRRPVARVDYRGPKCSTIPPEHKWVYPVDEAHTLPHCINVAARGCNCRCNELAGWRELTALLELVW